MSHHEIDAYLAKVGEPHRSTLQALRVAIHEIVPDAEEVISYGMPGFQFKGKMICGFAAFKRAMSPTCHTAGRSSRNCRRSSRPTSGRRARCIFQLISRYPKAW